MLLGSARSNYVTRDPPWPSGGGCWLHKRDEVKRGEEEEE